MLIALLLVACGEQPPSGSRAPYASGPGGEPGQILRLSYSETGPAETGPLDPAVSFDVGALHLLVRGLTGLDEAMRTVPAIAEAWEVSQEGTHITFHLREASYSNGEPIVAADFVYGWRRVLDPRTESGWGYLLADVVGAADLLALDLDAFPAADVLEAMLTGLGVSAPDQRTLEVDLVRPAAYFVTVVTAPATAPISESWITRPGATEAGAFVSSGPFVLTEWVHDQYRTFEPNPMWWGDPPGLDRVEMRVLASDEDALAAFRRGEIDVLDLPALPGSEDLDALAQPRPGGSLRYIGFDMLRPGSPTARSSALRRALSLAMDRDELNTVEGLSGPVASGPIPAGVPGHDPNLMSVFDPIAARRYLAEALDELGLTNPGELRLIFIHGTRFGDGPRYLELQWETVLGIDVERVALEPDQYVERLFSGRHDYDVAWRGWAADYPHPHSYLAPLWGCERLENNYGYCNRAFDELLDRAARTGDIDSQLALYVEAQRVLVDDLAALFLQWPGGYTLVAPWVEGLVLTPMDGFGGSLFLGQVRILPRN